MKASSVCVALFLAVLCATRVTAWRASGSAYLGRGRGGLRGPDRGGGFPDCERPRPRCFVCGAGMNRRRDGRLRCSNHDSHFVTVYHQTSAANWASIHSGGRFLPSPDGFVYASPMPQDTFTYASNKGIIVKLSTQRSHLDFSFTSPGRVRFSPHKDYNIEAFAVVSNRDSLATCQWTNVHIRVR
ncbi:unnamed protein product [Vitrella brassicaformis CCMP3155]|uniref:Uncharacterized protein n=1 Tax=Vitrella brassicaformis (strain CCMP3155) TaxID=1169540 RepID=A0A0G4EB45_VITBC|nr:unnamed protein product [Vitrella brassicaformis CCMP3155]|eukprot:CEL92473.1 unnamed protein product [Vitrella brassicaformis CCMP3155]